MNPCEAPILKLENYKFRKNLESVVIIARHGDRSPLRFLPDDHLHQWDCVPSFYRINQTQSQKITIRMQNGWNGSCGLGKLTQKGYNQMKEMGFELSKIYRNITNVYIRTTDSQRTLESALGFFEGFGIKNIQINVPIDDDDLHIKHKNPDKKLLKFFSNEFKVFSDRIKSIVPMQNDTYIVPASAGSLWCRYCWKKQVPLTQKDMEELRVMESFNMFLRHDSSRVKEALFGLFLNKFSVAIAHDSTIAAILSVLNESVIWPGYRSSIILEKYPDCYRVFFNGEYLKQINL